MNVPFALAYLAGVLAAFNPCGFALLPAYLAWFVGTSGPRAAARSRGALAARALVVSGALTLGFVVVFGVVGTLVQTLSLQVSRFAPWFTVVVGVALVVLGSWLVSGRSVVVRLPKFAATVDGEAGLPGMVVFGASYATVSLSCTLPPFLAAVVATFSADSYLAGVGAFAAYAAGMGSVVAVLSLALALAQAGAVTRMRRVQRVVQRVAGGLLVVAGAYAAWYGIYELLVNAGREVGGGPVAWVSSASSEVGLVLGRVGAPRLALVAGTLVIGALAIGAPRWRRRPGT